jgi:hypothetical protein
MTSDGNGVSGIKQSDIDDIESGASIDDSGSLYYENASAQHNGASADATDENNSESN